MKEEKTCHDEQENGREVTQETKGRHGNRAMERRASAVLLMLESVASVPTIFALIWNDGVCACRSVLKGRGRVWLCAAWTSCLILARRHVLRSVLRSQGWGLTGSSFHAAVLLALGRPATLCCGLCSTHGGGGPIV